MSLEGLETQYLVQMRNQGVQKYVLDGLAGWGRCCAAGEGGEKIRCGVGDEWNERGRERGRCEGLRVLGVG